ncbi:MAG: hypothetical protein ACI9G1_004769 [Pirellulaceae bacterium]|jgi:hypothetical protein
MTNSDPTKSDLNWTAFCYVTGELSDAAHREFEELLAKDQPAREAVALAVELGQSICAANHLNLRPIDSQHAYRQASRKSFAIAAGFVVASVLGFLAVTMNLWQQPTVDQQANADPALALAWSQAKTEYEENNLALASEFQENELEEFDEVEMLTTDESSFDAPLWMLTAVSVQQQALEAESVELEN